MNEAERLKLLIEGGKEDNFNVVEQMILYLTTPIAKRKGVFFTSDDCAIWVEELRNYLKENERES